MPPLKLSRQNRPSVSLIRIGGRRDLPLRPERTRTPFPFRFNDSSATGAMSCGANQSNSVFSDGRRLFVVDQPASIDALPIAVARDEGVSVAKSEIKPRFPSCHPSNNAAHA